MRISGGPFNRKGLGREDSMRYMWAEKGKWVGQCGPSEMVGRRLKQKPMWRLICGRASPSNEIVKTCEAKGRLDQLSQS